jgi:hypothetical protein
MVKSFISFISSADTPIPLRREKRQLWPDSCASPLLRPTGRYSVLDQGARARCVVNRHNATALVSSNHILYNAVCQRQIVTGNTTTLARLHV